VITADRGGFLKACDPVFLDDGFREFSMNFNVLAVACAACMFAGSASAVVAPGQSLGQLSANHALFAGFASPAASTSFVDSYSFSLGQVSDLSGSVGQLFGSVSFSKIWLDNIFVVPTAIDSGYSFSFGGVSEGLHTLKVAGLESAGFDGYSGSISAVASATSQDITPSVPEPATFALGLTALGLLAWAGRRNAR